MERSTQGIERRGDDVCGRARSEAIGLRKRWGDLRSSMGDRRSVSPLGLLDAAIVAAEEGFPCLELARSWWAEPVRRLPRLAC